MKEIFIFVVFVITLSSTSNGIEEQRWETF